MGLIALSALTPWQLFQSLCPYVSTQSSQCLGTGTQQQQQQQPFTQQQQQQQPSTTVIPSTPPQ